MVVFCAGLAVAFQAYVYYDMRLTVLSLVLNSLGWLLHFLSFRKGPNG
jgi:hypothetical protein